MAERFTTEVGRLLQGDPFTPQDKDMQGNPRVVKSGPNAGQPNPQYFIGVGFPKTPGVSDWRQEPSPFFQSVARTAQQDFPRGEWQWPHFAWKIIDGDSPALNQRGRAWNTIEGYPGHWVVRFQSSYPPKCFHAGRYAAADQIQDKNAIRRGYWIRVNGSVTGNNDTAKPGVYLNLDMVELAGYGQEIMSGPDASEAFGAGPVALPPGASATPVLATPVVPQGTPPVMGYVAPAPNAGAVVSPVPLAGTATPPAPVPYVAPVQPTLAPVTPVANGASPSSGAPVAATTTAPYAGFIPTPPPVAGGAYPTGKVMLPAANGATYEQMIATGWTDTLLIQNGMMVG